MAETMTQEEARDEVIAIIERYVDCKFRGDWTQAKKIYCSPEFTQESLERLILDIQTWNTYG